MVHKLSTIVSPSALPSFFVSSMDKEVKLQKKGARAKNGCGGQKTGELSPQLASTGKLHFQKQELKMLFVSM